MTLPLSDLFELLIEVLRDDIRLFTLLKSEFDAEVQLKLNSRGTRMKTVLAGVEVFWTLGTVRSSKKASPKLPWTSLAPRMDINPSSSADRASKVSLTTFHANPSPVLLPLTLPRPRCPTSAV